MAVPARYPGSTKDSNYNRAGGVWNGKGKWKLCLHTTETAGEPGYNDNYYAPHLTYLPKTRKWVQHYDLTRPSESLRTYDNWQVFQVEIACYSAKHIADASSSRLWVGELSDTHLNDLADFTKWLQGYVPIPSVWPNKQAFSYGQANASNFRMTETEFRNFGGILAHQHTPYPNTHWDVGGFPWDKYMNLLDTPDEGGDMPLDEIGKAVVDIAFELFGATGDKNYWYAKEPDDPEFANLRNAIVTGAAKIKAHTHDEHVTKGEKVTIRGTT